VATFESGDANVNISLMDSTTTAANYVGIGAVGNNLTLISGNGSERMRINSSGNVGIGTTSIDEKLHVQGSVNNDDVAIKIENTYDDNLSTSRPAASLQFATASNNAYLRVFGAPADTAANHQIDLGSTAGSSFITLSPAGSERMRIDSSGNVGIGTSSPDTYQLAVDSGASGTSNALAGIFVEGQRSGVVYNLVSNNTDNGINKGSGIQFRSGGFLTSGIIGRSDAVAASGDAPGYLTFHTSTNGSEDFAEAMRIDSSGNLLVGKTSPVSTTTGFYVLSDGFIAATRDNNRVALLNRLNSDGTLVSFQKNGTTVGSIGASGGDLLIGTGNTGLLFYDASPQIIPRNTTGANVDATVDLGSSGSRFKDLHLSGQANVGSVLATGNVTAYSDERLKDNIQTLQGSKVLEMRGVSYTKDGEASSGVIAQEIEKVAPELVHTAKDEMGTKSVAYGNLVGYLIEAIKDQQKEIEYMKSEIKTLKENK
jgi:hypothetical protein